MSASRRASAARFGAAAARESRGLCGSRQARPRRHAATAGPSGDSQHRFFLFRRATATREFVRPALKIGCTAPRQSTRDLPVARGAPPAPSSRIRRYRSGRLREEGRLSQLRRSHSLRQPLLRLLDVGSPVQKRRRQAGGNVGQAHAVEGGTAPTAAGFSPISTLM